MTQTRQYKLGDVNAMDEKTFVLVFGAVFEGSPWATQMAFNMTPFESCQELIDTLCQSIRDADHDTQMALLCAHQELRQIPVWR